MEALVSASEGVSVGNLVGLTVVGKKVGSGVGTDIGAKVGTGVGSEVGRGVGAKVGSGVVGTAVGANDGPGV